MFTRKMITLILLICLIFSLSACSKPVEISDDTTLTREEMLVEYYPYKQSVYKQLESKIHNFDKLEETEFKIVNDETKEWSISLKMDKDVFNIPKTQYIFITAQKTTITYNSYEEIKSEIIGQKKAQADVTRFLKQDTFIEEEVLSDSTSYVYTIDGILNPTEEDFNNPNNKFYLHLHINGEKTRNTTTCTDEYFADLNNKIEEMLSSGEFANKQNITTIIYIAGCGELKQRKTNGQTTFSISRSEDGKSKIKTIEAEQKSDDFSLANLSPDEQKSFLEERQKDIETSQIKSEENKKNADSLNQ